MAHDAIQAIKQLRRDVVEAMRSLMKLAKDKQTAGMLPICEDMVTKTRILLSLWDPGLVEEALTFLEEYKVAKVATQVVEDVTNDNPTNLTLNFKTTNQPGLSPFKRITQQLNFDLRSPDFDEFVTPDTPTCVQDIWAKESARNNHQNHQFSSLNEIKNDINSNGTSKTSNENNFVIFPEVKVNNKSEEDNNNEDRGPDSDLGKRFLDTQKMCNSPSANYYKPTDEPEPWDLTQLNIEASVMCLVSKVKFLCGRCSSPAVRLRSKNGIKRSQPFTACITNNLNSVSVVTIQKNGIVKEEPDKVCQTPVKNSVAQRNKFTEGLDFDSIVDWTSELRPSMKKLRQAMDGLLKTARLTHSVFRVQEDAKSAQKACNVRYRRDVCFSQAVNFLMLHV